MTNGELRRVLLLGPPGAGKGTLGPHLSELLGVPHISAGRLLRASAAEGRTVLLASHELDRARSLADREVTIVAGQMRLPGTPAESAEPAEPAEPARGAAASGPSLHSQPAQQPSAKGS